MKERFCEVPVAAENRLKLMRVLVPEIVQIREVQYFHDYIEADSFLVSMLNV